MHAALRRARVGENTVRDRLMVTARIQSAQAIRSAVHRPSLSWAVLAISLLAQLLVLVEYVVSPGYRTSSPGANLSTLAAFAISGSLAVAVFSSTTRFSFRVLIVLRCLVIMLLVSETPLSRDTRTGLTLSLLLETAIYEPFFVNLLISVAVVVAVLLVNAWAHLLNEVSAVNWTAVLVNEANFVVHNLAFAVAACLAIHYRKPRSKCRSAWSDSIRRWCSFLRPTSDTSSTPTPWSRLR